MSYKQVLTARDYEPLHGMIIAAIKVSGGCIPQKVPEVLKEAQRLRDKSGRWPDEIIRGELTKLGKKGIIKYDQRKQKWVYLGKGDNE